jgi:S-(hydroxymethyl)glutathione dehydrogenase/alcohol dehydrogenase
VIGCGGIGMCSVQGARIAGASQIIAIDPIAEKRQIALSVGATHVIDPNACDPLEEVRELTGGAGVDYAFEAVGVAALVRQAWDMAAIDGTVVAIGVCPVGTEVALPAVEFCTTEKTLKACVYGTSRPRQDMPVYLDMYKRGVLKLDEIISRRYTLDQINEAIADLDAGRIHGRGVFSTQ